MPAGEPGEGKRAVWIVARQHPGESMAEWFMEGLLRALLNSHHGLSRELLKQAVFYVVRLLCPNVRAVKPATKQANREQLAFRGNQAASAAQRVFVMAAAPEAPAMAAQCITSSDHM